MTIAHVASGTTVGGTTSLIPAYPSGVAAGVMAFLVVNVKPETATIADVSGWTEVAQLTGGTGTQGIDTGLTRLRVFQKELVGSESGTVTVTLANSPNSACAFIALYSKTAASWFTAASSGSDNTHGTGRTIVGGTAIDITANDRLCAFHGSDTDATTATTSRTFTASGITFGSTTVRKAPGGTNTGQDSGAYNEDAPVNSGTATIAPTITHVGGPSNCGCAVMVRLREGAALTPVNKDVDLQWRVVVGPYIESWADAVDSADATTHTANLPVHAANDRLIAIVSFDTDGNPETVSSWTDWTHGSSVALGAGSAHQRLEWKHRTVTGTESWFGQSSMTFTTGYSTQAAVRVFCIKKSDIGTSIASVASATTGSSANVAALDPSWGAEDTLWILGMGYADKTTIGTLANYTAHGLIQTGGATNTAASLQTYERATNATSEDPAAITLGASVNWVAFLLGIREVQTIVTKDVELIWDVEVLSPVGKTIDVRWETLHNVGRLAYLRSLHNGAYNWSQVQIPRDNPATSWDGTYQYVSWVSPTRHYMLAKRRHGSDFGSAPADLFNQTPTAFNALAELDNHNYISIGVDTDGYIHLAGGMHGGGGGPDDALRYMRSANPNDIGSWVVPGGGTGVMVGTSETLVTYPQFINLADGTLLFFYRAGESGIGDWLINQYNTTTDTWSRVGTIWLAGITDGVSAYPTMLVDPRVGTLGRIHSFWTWREDQGGAESNRYICYGYSDDGGATWKKSDATSYTLPITEATSEQLYDPPLSGTGTILNNPSTGFNQAGNPQCVVLLETATPNLREYHHIHFNGTVWDDINTGITGGGRPPIVKFDSGTVWALLRTVDASGLGGVMAYDLTTPGTPSTKMLWSGNSIQAEWSVDTRALDLRDELHLIVGAARAAGIQAGDSLDLGQDPGHAVLIVDETDSVVNPILHRHGPATFQTKTTAATWQITPGIAAAVGEYVVITLAHDPATLTGITDSKSNTWTSGRDIVNASGSHLRIWYSKITTAFLDTDTVTFTWSASTNDKAAVVDVWSGIAATGPVAGGADSTGSSTTPSASRAAETEGNLIYGAVAVEGPVEDVYTVAPDADTAWSVVARNGTTGSTADTNTTVNRQYAFIDGAPVTRTFAPVLGTSRDWTAAVVEFKPEPAVASTNLVVADGAHAHTADNITLTQVHELVVAEALSAHSVDNVALTQVHVLTVADAQSTHTADNIVLTQVHNLVVGDAISAHTADNVVLTTSTILVVADAQSAHAADNVTLTQTHNLTVADAVSTHTADNITLTQVHVLTVDDGAHSHTADGPLSLTQVHQLVVADTQHTHVADNVVLSLEVIVPSVFRRWQVQADDRTLVVAHDRRVTMTVH